MKVILLLLTILTTLPSLAESFDITKDGKTYTCKSSDDSTEENTCAIVSRKKFGYIISDCEKVKNDAQDACAIKTIEKFGYITNDCLKLEAGKRCSLLSLDKFGYIINDCLKISNKRQDVCAVDSIKTFGYINNSCLQLK